MHANLARRSRRVESDVAEFGPGFAMLKLICHNPESQGLDPGLRLHLGRSLGKHARKFGDFGDPPTVFLSIKRDLESHCSDLRAKCTAVAVDLALPGEHPASPAKRASTTACEAGAPSRFVRCNALFDGPLRTTE